MVSFSYIVVDTVVLCYKAFLMLKVMNVGTPGSLQPHPPKDRVFDKQGSKKLQVYSAGRERLASSGKHCILDSVCMSTWEYRAWFGECMVKVLNSGEQCLQMLYLVATEREVKAGRCALLRPAGRKAGNNLEQKTQSA